MKSEITCKYHGNSIVCVGINEPRKIKCSECGWNPDVAAARLRKMGIKPHDERKKGARS